MKTKTLKYLIAIGFSFLVISGTVYAQNSSLWRISGTLLQPILNAWDIYAPDELRFDGEIQPDGDTCSNGQILKKTGADNWDCATDSTGGGIDGSGTLNEITYWVDSDTLGTLAVATYPSLTELSYVKGVTSAIQTQIGGLVPYTGATQAVDLGVTGEIISAYFSIPTNSGGELAIPGSGITSGIKFIDTYEDYNNWLYVFSAAAGQLWLSPTGGVPNAILDFNSVVTSDKTFTFPNKSMTFAGTNDKLSAFAATTSLELLGVISDETGTGLSVFNNSPVFTTPNIGSATGSITGNAGTATALAGDPADCGAGTFADAINASGTLTCNAVVSADITDGTITLADTAITAGRSLTIATDDILADAELYTDTKC